MRVRRLFTFGFLQVVLFGCMALSSHAFARDYVVRAGDTASAIALKELGLPVWRSGGSLEKLLAANPQVKNPDRIWPGLKFHVMVAKAKRHVSSAETPPAPPPPRAPASEFPVSRVGVALRLEFFRIDSEDRSSGTNATFLSNLSPTFDGEWGVRWSRDWESLVQVGYRKEQILAPTDPTKSVSGGNVARYRAGMGVVRHWGTGDRTSLVLSRESFLFARAISSATVQIDAVETEALAHAHRHALVSVGTAELGFEGKALALAPADGFGYRVRTGWGAQGAAYVAHELSSVAMQAEGFFQYSSQSSTLVRQTQRNLGLSLGVSWSFR